MSTETITEVETQISDEAVLKQLTEWLESRVSITTGFIPDEDSGLLTHQVLEVRCGDYVMVSQPEPLEIPLRPASKEELIEQGVTIN